MIFNGGLLYERVVMSYPVSSSLDEFGQTQIAYASSSLWAQVKMRNGTVTDKNGIVLNRANYVFTLRANSNISDDCIYNFRGDNYYTTFIEKPDRGSRAVIVERRN